MKLQGITNQGIQRIALTIKPKSLRTLWFENEAGDIYEPPMDEAFEGVPEGFKYQWSRFPTMLRENCLVTIDQKDVDECDHLDKYIKTDHGLIDGLEGRECEYCGGHQQKDEGEPWPHKWEAYGSRDLMSGEMSFPEDLVIAIVKSGDYDLGDAIIISATCCERCMNSLADQYGLDWGYPEYGEEWEEYGTNCEFCEE